jgi:hypothetical protein
VTSTDDYLDEMPASRPLDDATAEDLFAGRPVPPDLEPLATMMQALRDVSRQPVPPSAELAARMAAGTAVVVPAGPGLAGGRLPRTARRVAATVAATAGRIGWAARLAVAGAAVSVIGISSAGFAGTLPGPVQDRFETTVESVTPYQFPMRTGDRPETGEPAGPADGPGTGDGDGTGDRTVPGSGDQPGGGPGTGTDPGGGSGPGGGPPPGTGVGPPADPPADPPAGPPADPPAGPPAGPPADPPGQQHRPTAPPGP